MVLGGFSFFKKSAGLRSLGLRVLKEVPRSPQNPSPSARYPSKLPQYAYKASTIRPLLYSPWKYELPDVCQVRPGQTSDPYFPPPKGQAEKLKFQNPSDSLAAKGQRSKLESGNLAVVVKSHRDCFPTRAAANHPAYNTQSTT